MTAPRGKKMTSCSATTSTTTTSTSSAHQSADHSFSWGPGGTKNQEAPGTGWRRCRNRGVDCIRAIARAVQPKLQYCGRIASGLRSRGFWAASCISFVMMTARDLGSAQPGAAKITALINRLQGNRLDAETPSYCDAHLNGPRTCQSCLCNPDSDRCSSLAAPDEQTKQKY